MAGEGEGGNQPVTGKADVRKEQPVSAEKTPWRALATAAFSKQKPGSQPDDDRKADEHIKTALPAQMQLQPGAHQRRTGDENPAGGGHPDPQAFQLPAGEQILNQRLRQRKRPATHCLNHAKYQKPGEITGEQAARCAHCCLGYSSQQQLLAPEHIGQRPDQQQRKRQADGKEADRQGDIGGGGTKVLGKRGKRGQDHVEWENGEERHGHQQQDERRFFFGMQGVGHPSTLSVREGGEEN
ncbi:hypothetical protein D3C84_605120 [compost metagenome]